MWRSDDGGRSWAAKVKGLPNTDIKAFAGGSFVFGPSGKPLFQAPESGEALAFVDLDLGEIRSARERWTFKRDDLPELIHNSLGRIVRGHDD